MLGRLGSAYVLASETCALDIVGAEFVREIENGEIVTITADGVESHRPFPRRPARPCIFEYIYFARPDSIVGGRNVYDIRKQMGAQLAREAPAKADVIIPIPDSGVPAAIGYAQESGMPFELGIIRNHYVGRTFIEPEQRIRQLGVKLKHSANASAVRGNRIVLIDDSVVRGTTSKKIVQMMFEAGAREVHLRVSSPPITHPDFYGIDTPRPTELLAANMSVRGDARVHRRHQPGVPVRRRHLSRARLREARCAQRRSSPTTASPATTPPSSSTRTGRPTAPSSRSWPRCAEGGGRGRLSAHGGAMRFAYCAYGRAATRGSALSGTCGPSSMTMVWPVMVSVRHMVTTMSAQSSLSAAFFSSEPAGRARSAPAADWRSRACPPAAPAPRS